jgi:protease-4
MAASSESTSATTVLYVVVVVVAVLVATVLAPVVYSATTGSGDSEGPSVAVLTLRGGTSGANVAAISEDLRQVRNNDSVDAVVMRIDSPGGAVTSSEEFYLAMNRTAAEMPVVTYVEGYAASGGYFGIAPSDAIYVKPSSLVGSVGVVATLPAQLESQNAQVRSALRTGPDKQLQTIDSVREELELLQNAFVGTVMEHRGDELTLSRTEVSNAATYRGTEAVQNGFADEIGTLESAIQRAATEADSIEGDSYGVYYKAPPQVTTGAILLSDADVESTNGSIVYVDQREDTGTEFVPPVRYYAAYGIPESALENQEVVTNETG